MGIDLNTLSGDELIALKRDADKALQSLDARNRTEALKSAEAAAREHGYTLKELMGGKSASTKAAGVAKYANPADASQTWSGKGRQPEWFKTAMAAGKNRDDLEL
jgi:DNA-binding protein H-NS